MQKILPLLAAVGVAMSGCFSYVPTDLAAVTPGEPVKVELSRVALSNMLLADSLSTQVGPLVRGTLARRDRDDIFIRLPADATYAGPRGADFGQDVRIPTGGVLQIGTRKVNWLGTGLTLGATAGAAVLLARYIMGGAQAGYLPTAAEPDNLRVPLPIRGVGSSR
jgi:hypothetical protein